jgi:hypothetical protein
VSAGTELDKGAIARGLLIPQPRVPSEPRVRPIVGPNFAELRSQYPLAVLSRDHDSVCTRAVDAAEIAASLESAGLNDRMVREDFRVGNVFELSRQLYDLVPRRANVLTPASDPWYFPKRRHLGRGVLYALPMLPYAAVLRLLHVSTAVIVTLLVGNVVAMALTQAVSHLAHSLKGHGAPGSAARLLRPVLMFAIAAATAAGAVASFTHALPRGATAVAAGQLVYVVAATVLLIFDRDRLLLWSLLPIAVGSALAVVVPPERVSADLLALFGGVLGGAIVAITTMAWTTTGAVIRQLPNERRVTASAADIRSASLHGLYGALTAGLLMFAILDIMTSGGHHTVSSFVGIGMLPLAASLGFAEMQLYAFRSDCTTLLHRVHELSAFAKGVRRSLAARGLRYGLALGTLTAVVLVPASLAHQVDSVAMLRHLDYAILGIALLGAMVLASCQLTGRAVLLLAAALGGDLASRGLPMNVVTLSLVHLVAFTVLAVAAWATAAVTLGSPFRHR